MAPEVIVRASAALLDAAVDFVRTHRCAVLHTHRRFCCAHSPICCCICICVGLRLPARSRTSQRECRRAALWVQEDADYAAVEGVRLRQKAESLRDRLAASEAQRLRAKEGRDASDTQRAAAERRCAALESDAAALNARLAPMQVQHPASA